MFDADKVAAVGGVSFRNHLLRYSAAKRIAPYLDFNC